MFITILLPQCFIFISVINIIQFNTDCVFCVRLHILQEEGMNVSLSIGLQIIESINLGITLAVAIPDE